MKVETYFLLAGVIILILATGFYISNELSQKPRSGAELHEDYVIEIAQFQFSPQELRIKQGEVVLWKNKDFAKHTVTSETGTELDSDILESGDEYIHRFNTKGEFPYYCTTHSYMIGKIIVE